MVQPGSSRAPGILVEPPRFAKLTTLTIVHGTVYAPTFSGFLVVYGLLAR